MKKQGLTLTLFSICFLTTRSYIYSCYMSRSTVLSLSPSVYCPSAETNRQTVRGVPAEAMRFLCSPHVFYLSLAVDTGHLLTVSRLQALVVRLVGEQLPAGSDPVCPLHETDHQLTLAQHANETASRSCGERLNLRVAKNKLNEMLIYNQRLSVF